MPLHPQIHKMLSDLAAAGVPSFHMMPVEVARGGLRQLMVSMPPSASEIAKVENRSINGGKLPLRIYTPATAATGPLPILLYLHGGGWVLGDLDAYDTTCRELAGGAGCIVVSADYRLAPEHRFPAAADDALMALQWVIEHGTEIGGDTARIAVGGDSAGGNLAAVTAIAARERFPGKVRAQLLVYPVTDHYSGPSRSMHDNGEGYLLTRNDMLWFFDHYLGSDGNARDPRVNLSQVSKLDGLPPALVMTAEFDPLRDEGEVYARALQQAGNSVQMSRYDGAVHGFFTFSTGLDLGAQAMREACSWLRTQFGTR